MRVKICGITDPQDAAMCEEAGANALGFVHFPGRRRSLPLDRISDICGTIGPLITTVLVSSPTSLEEAVHMVDESGVDVLQTYSLEPGDIGELRDRGIRTIRAVELDITQVRRFDGIADALVFETGIPGTGTQYDYSQIPLELSSRSIIAGGLNPENVENVRSLDPYGVDVSSGVERTPGRKDKGLVIEFIRRSVY